MSACSLKGTFCPPGDKSVSHRVALFSLLATGECRVRNFSDCADCGSTLAAVIKLGGRVDRAGDDLVIRGAAGQVTTSADIDCGNSGTTIRMLQGILAGRSGQYRLDGDDSLRRRPMERVAAPLRLMGADVSTSDGKPPVTIRGTRLHGTEIAMAVASAQLKTALLLAGIQADGPTRITEPASSRDHSERLLLAWGSDLKREGGAVVVAPGPLHMQTDFTVPGDASGAAFFLCAAAVTPGSDVLCRDVMLNPSRTGWMDVLARMGADLDRDCKVETPEPMGSVRAMYSAPLQAAEVPSEEIPNIVDEVPILAVVATQASGETVFRDAGELRVKESDRLTAIVTELSRFGADISVAGDDLCVRGPVTLTAPRESCRSYGDHRIAMALRMASLLCDNPVSIEDEACAAVSYPGFADTFAQLTEGATR